MKLVQSLKLSVAAILLLPVFASADPVHVSFEGVFTSGYGDYSYGDEISGYFEFDTDDLYSSPSYWSCGNNYVNVDSSFDKSSAPSSSDQVYTCNDQYGYFDRQYVRDGSYGWTSNSDGSYYYSNSHIYIDIYDYYGGVSGDWSDAWYNQDQLDGLSNASGYVYNYSYGYAGGYQQGYDYNYSYGRFDLTSLHIGGMKVSEPGTLALFGLGLIGLAFARRRKSA